MKVVFIQLAMCIPEVLVVKLTAVDRGPWDTVTAATLQLYFVLGCKELISRCVSGPTVCTFTTSPRELLRWIT